MLNFMKICSVTISVFLMTWACCFAEVPEDSPPICAVTGNGGLTVSLDSVGSIRTCRWPSPGYLDQLGHPDNGDEGGKRPALIWGLRDKKSTLLSSDSRWNVETDYLNEDSVAVRSLFTQSDTHAQVLQTVFVHPEHDILSIRLVVKGVDDLQRIYWFADFSPSTRLIPELPIYDWIPNSLNDFAVFYNENSLDIYHFRPENLERDDWIKARSLIATSASTERWAEFGNGVWIGSSVAGGIQQFQCGINSTNSSGLKHVIDGALGGTFAAAGQSNWAFEIEPVESNNDYVADIFIAFHQEYGEVQKKLEYARKRGYEELLDDAESHWKGWLTEVCFSKITDPVISAYAKRCMLTVAMGVDRKTGAIITNTASEAGMAFDWPRDGAWLTYALDITGYHELAAKHIAFYANTVRKEFERGKPIGSMPVALYANGQEAMPHLLLEVDAAVWTLWSFWNHAGFLEGDNRQEYITGIWDSVERLTDFLINWTSGASPISFYSFSTALCRDSKEKELIPLMYIGIEKGLKFAEELGHDKPQWERRSGELEALIFLHCLDSDGNWNLEKTVPFDPDIDGAGADKRWQISPAWQKLMMLKMEELPGLYGLQAARSLCEVAFYFQDKKERRQELRELLEPVLSNALTIKDGNGSEQIYVDTLNSALCYIAICLCYENSE